ncbi:MAG TPA: hypothetical protein DCR14_15385 [Acidimicrobiaceae bacterium]|nr:hypothetical protein [Acidimicrobiaceae bacterium]
MLAAAARVTMFRMLRWWTREEHPMGGKTPQKASAKKVGKSLKEKRAVKQEKKDSKRGTGLV